MNIGLQHGRKFASLVGVACLAGGAFAQGLISTNGVIVANIGDTIPDTAGAPMAGFTFGGSGNFDSPVVDSAGNVVFRARFIDGNTPSTTTTWNDRAYFFGSSRANLRMVIRGDDQAPGLPAGITLRSTTGSSSTLTSSPRIASNGDLFWGALFIDSTGGGAVTSADDEALFGGPVGAQTMFLRQNAPAPGTVGATFVQAFSSPSQQTSGMNGSGSIYFQATIGGGDVVGLTNRQGIWAGPPSSLVLVQRMGSLCDGLPNNFLATTGSPLGFTVSMNASGQVFEELTLDLVLGTTPAVAANDKVYMLYTPGSGSAVLVREGDTAPGTVNATFNAVSGDSWSAGYSANHLKNNGTIIFTSTLRGGDVVGTTNDSAVFQGGVGTMQMVVRKGDAAPGIPGATFLSFNNNNTLHNNAGVVCLDCALTGGAVTTANDSTIWTGTPGNLQLVAREGDVMPGTGGGICGSMSGTSRAFNDRGQILFTMTLAGGTAPGSSWWLYNPGQGLVPVVLNTDQIEVSPGVFKTFNGVIGSNSLSNADGASLCLSNSGKFGTRVSFSDGTAAIMVLQLPSPVAGTNFCFGDGLDTSHTTPCPCANNGAAGNGCANSVNANGAHLGAGGSTFDDDVVLSGSGMPLTSSCIYLQGDALDDTSFGDGVRCAGGSLIRLRTRFNVAGASDFPDSTDTITLSARGGVTPGSGAIRYYQTYYRNAAGLFCPPETFNVTNGVAVTW